MTRPHLIEGDSRGLFTVRGRVEIGVPRKQIEETAREVLREAAGG